MRATRALRPPSIETQQKIALCELGDGAEMLSFEEAGRSRATKFKVAQKCLDNIHMQNGLEDLPCV
jgi:hypothetical protein